MPGKVNPVIPELINIIAFRVMGNDHSVSLAAHHGQLQLNAYEPLVGLAVNESQGLLYRGSIAFRTKCIDGITLNEKTLSHYMETTVGIVTALNPVVGYEKATELAGELKALGLGLLSAMEKRDAEERSKNAQFSLRTGLTFCVYSRYPPVLELDS